MDQLEELRALIRSRRYVQAARDAEALLAGDLGPAEKAHIYHIQAVALYHSDQVWPALQAERRAEALAGEWGLTDLGGRVRVNLVAMLTAVGDCSLALEVGARLLASEGELSPEVRREMPRVRYNLARVHHARREAEEAYQLLGQAIAEAEASEFSSGFQVDAHQLMAWWLLLDHRVKEAAPHIEAAASLIQPEDLKPQREQLLLACLRAYEMGEWKTAALLAEELATPGAPSTKLQAGWACLIAGWVAVEGRFWEQAQTCAKAALDHAIDLGWPELMNRTNDLRKRIAEGKAAG